jgi:hypothetical protein
MEVSVYHVTNPTFRVDPDAAKTLVAKVHVRDASAEEMLDQAYELTNHITRDWTTGPNVVEVFATRARSTSVGDFIQIDDVMYVCDIMGWKRVISLAPALKVTSDDLEPK